MTVKHADKEYNLSFNNWKLHQYGKACGFETLDETLNTFAEFASISEGGKMTLKLSEHLANLCGQVADIDPQEAMEVMYNSPMFITECVAVALDALPKPHAEGVSDKKKAELLNMMTS